MSRAENVQQRSSTDGPRAKSGPLSRPIQAATGFKNKHQIKKLEIKKECDQI